MTTVEDQLTGGSFPELVHFFKFYKTYVHGYASLITCMVGSVTNIINIIVLTRKNMVSSTNIMLTGLAVADLAQLLNYIPLTWHKHLRPQSHSFEEAHTYEGTLFELWLENFAVICRTISIWMVIMLAIWRFMAIVYPLKPRNWCSIKTTSKVVVAGFVLSPIISIPAFISNSIMLVNAIPDQSANQSVPIINYKTELTDTEILNIHYPLNLSCFIFCVFKLTPSILLTILTLRLVFALLKANKRRLELISSLNPENARDSHKEEQTNRTTRMLMVVLFLFLATEVPNGITALIHIILRFDRSYHHNIADVINLLTMIDATSNFPVFYFMSSQFRITCHALFNCNTFPAARADRQTKSPMTTETTI